MKAKEQFLSALKNEKPMKWMGYAFNAFPPGFPVIWDPVTMIDAANSGTYVDAWGATWRHEESDPGAVPIVTDENKVIKNLENWREYVVFPDLSNLDWHGVEAQLSGLNRDEQFVMIPSFYGPFERLHSLMTFEDALIAMYEEPELVEEIISAITDWKIEAMGHIIDNVQPDIIHSHDDWGSKTALFFSPQKFRDILKPHYTRLYKYIKSRDVLVQHHSDGFCQGLECDIYEMGADMLQGVLPTNDIQLMKKNTEGKMLILGGIDNEVVDHADVAEDVIRAEVRRAIDVYAPGGAYLPCITSMVTINPRSLEIVIDECNIYGEIWLAKNS